MNYEELKQALDYISPSGLTYSEWAMVGMALKEAGQSVEVWEQWSARDGDRYHKGECASKWRTFRGAPNPVTENSIFKMARDRGWPGPADRELDWDDTITVQTAPGKVVDQSWLEGRDLVIPDQWDPADQLIQYLQALFEPTENVGYVTQSWQKDGKWLPSRGNWDRTAGDLIQELSKCNGDLGAVLGDYTQEAGAWIRFNPLDGNGCKNDNVTEYRFALVESDSIDLEKQNAIIHELELPCAALVYSGKKSLHAIVRIDASSYGEYQRRVEYLYSVCRKNGLEPDTQNKNPSRLSRMPGVMRNGQKQYLLETNIGQPTYEEWKEWVESQTDDLPDAQNFRERRKVMHPLKDELISGILRKGHKMLLAGPSKAGKSFALIELCICIAEGKPWLGVFPCAQGRVMYVNLELDEDSCDHRISDVYDALGYPYEHDDNIEIWNLRGLAVPMDKLAPKLIRRLKKRNFSAVIIDPIYKVITGDENSAEQMARFCGQFDKIAREAGCAVIYCHHHSKGAQGGKRSMDRASGSGVFARDPDAMLDMTELAPTDAIKKQLENRAACAACKDALDYFGKSDAYGQDDVLSRARMLEICREQLSLADRRDLDQEIQRRTQKALAQTAWRIEGTLREFARFEPVNLWFDYPIHKLDTGLLEDLQPESDFRTLGAKGASKRWAGGKEASAQKSKRELSDAFEACMMDGEVTIYAIAEYMDLKPRTVKTRLKADGGYWIDGEKVGRKEPGYRG